jgi:hypothetical protein
MGRPNRPVVAINPTNFEKRVYKTVYECATDLGTTGANVLQALNRNGICCGWRMYDSAETLRARIKKLEGQLKDVED